MILIVKGEPLGMTIPICPSLFLNPFPPRPAIPSTERLVGDIQFFSYTVQYIYIYTYIHTTTFTGLLRYLFCSGEWEYSRQVSRTGEDGTTEWEEVQGKVKGDKKFFEAEFQLVEYIGTEHLLP